MYMSRCIELGKNGLGTTFPNPSVGSIIVYNGKIIGEGFTSPYGGSHAEVNAINSVQDKSVLKESTLYVTLEPCSHYGKTPPCADLIVQHAIPNVVIGILDPHGKVAGKGIQKLKNAGCKLTIGVLERECKKHHKRFLSFHEKKRPYIILKWAETKDRFLAPEKDKRTTDREPYWISHMRSRQLVHQWRSEEQAILVGTSTVLEDNPKLNVRLWKGTSPTRILLDRSLKIDTDYQALDGKVNTIIITEMRDKKKYVNGIAYEVIDFSKHVAQHICDALHKHQILSVIIEGGTKTLQTFIDADLWDEARIFQGATSFGKGIKAPTLPHHKLISSKRIATDTLNFYVND